MPDKPSTASNPQAAEERADYRKRYDAKKKYADLYNKKRWHDLRAAILRKQPVCQDPFKIGCHEPSTIGDHIKDHDGDLRVFYDFSNLQGLCKQCHDRKTGETHGAAGKPIEEKPAIVDGHIRDYGEEEARR